MEYAFCWTSELSNLQETNASTSMGTLLHIRITNKNQYFLHHLRDVKVRRDRRALISNYQGCHKGVASDAVHPRQSCTRKLQQRRERLRPQPQTGGWG